jgi:DegV family protein with EDD domain
VKQTGSTKGRKYMSRVGIITDTTSCINDELLHQYNIGLVPTGLVIDGKVYQDQVEITAERFWQLFKEAQNPITTSAVSPGAFITRFEEMGKTSNDLVCILVSKALTASHQAAYSARDIVRQKNPKLNIQIIDSKNSTGALGYIVLEAARAAQQNKSVDEVMQVVNDLIPRVKYVAMLDTLKYLIRLGRAPRDAEGLEKMGVKPFIGMVNGTGLVENLGGMPGKEKAMFRLVEMVREHTDVSKPLHVMVHYADQIAEGEKIRDMLTASYNIKELYLTPYTPVMACHTGPVLSIAFYADKG